MVTIKDVYDNLKKYDKKNELTISDNGEIIELKIGSDDKIIAMDDYLSINFKNESITHWHPDCDGMYIYFLRIIKGIEKIPTKKDIKKRQRKFYLIVYISFIMCFLFYLLISEIKLLPILITFILILVFFLSLFLQVIFIEKIRDKRNGIGNQNERYQITETVVIKNDNVIAAYQFSKNNKQKVLKDHYCGCFYCLKIFTPEEITIWLGDEEETAVCPFCGINSVIGESSGYSITKEFMTKMHHHWFK